MPRGPVEGGDPLARTARNLLLTFTALACSGLLVTHRLFGPRQGIVVVAIVVALLLVAVLAYAWVYGAQWPAWVGMAAAFAASRSGMALATGRIFAARDAPDHIYGLPLHLLRTGNLSDEFVYSAYPYLQVLLAEVTLVTGLPLWEAAALLAVLLGVVTMALLARTVDALWPGASLFGAAGLLVAFLAIPPGQLYQPMTLSILLFAFLAFLVARGKSIAWAPGLFVIGLLTLGLTHPYSAVIVGLVLFVALTLHAFIRHDVRFLVPMGIVLGLGVAYVAYIGGDLSRFLDLLQPNDVAPIPLPDTGTSPGTGVGPEGPSADEAGSPASRFSDTYRDFGSWAFRVSMAVALAGWVLALRPRPLRAMFHQMLAGAAGLAYLASRLVSYGFPVRVLTIASVATAPFIGLALHRSPRVLALPAVAALAVLAMVSPAATYQFFPASQGDPTVHALDDPPETADLLRVFLEVEEGALRRSNPVSSDPAFHLDKHLLVRAFASTDRPGTSLHTHYIFRDDAIDFGFSTTTTQSGNPARQAAFVPYPTEGQLQLLRTLDRFGDFGSFALHRG